MKSAGRLPWFRPRALAATVDRGPAPFHLGMPQQVTVIEVIDDVIKGRGKKGLT